MTENIHAGFRDLIPDLVNGTLERSRLAEVESHLSACASCREEASAVRKVAESAIFAPRMDTSGIASAIPPYGIGSVVPLRVNSSRRRFVGWATLAAAAAIAFIALLRVDDGSPSVRSTANSVAVSSGSNPTIGTVARVAPQPESVGAEGVAASEPASQRPGYPVRAVRAIALAAGSNELSSSDLRQLMSDIETLDARPSADPDRVGELGTGEEGR